ncbi:MAG TPA: cytochrome b [Rhodocyclaceae bacterium]|nr:cytochrome b [Betaproteobacteria bacterium]HMU99513.1 cytochrome b [Rhodocyclaceae bacterium]HMV21090.1 cytochrome b [Rhodocyclaceae bacterium]HMW76631.1 cytochrome b [Rhodocyclaceae bacterium]HNE42849.1 cytochrome b [Rhodocyclaceae bacterium]
MAIQRYSLPAVAVHWLQAALVLWLFWLGWTMLDIPKGPERSAAFSLHKSLGLLAFLLVLMRLMWRRYSAPPALSGRRIEILAAKAVHHGLYVFLVLAPLAGYLSSSFTEYPMKFFGVPLPKAGWPDKNLNEAFKLAHEILVWGGMGLVGVHVGAALLHAFRRDGTFSRMLPGRSRT